MAVVDDDADVRVALMRLISSAGFATETFASGAEFMKSLSDSSPECLVLDLHMPEVSGFEVQQLLHERHVEMPVVIITGRDTAESRSRALGLGAMAYLAKPVDGDSLLQAISTALYGQEASRER
ncbi:MAG: response regulator [Burkholderiales bacterium]|nr:response regulator [Burkholderiales bacterium]